MAEERSGLDLDMSASQDLPSNGIINANVIDAGNGAVLEDKVDDDPVKNVRDGGVGNGTRDAENVAELLHDCGVEEGNGVVDLVELETFDSIDNGKLDEKDEAERVDGRMDGGGEGGGYSFDSNFQTNESLSEIDLDVTRSETVQIDDDENNVEVACPSDLSVDVKGIQNLLVSVVKDVQSDFHMDQRKQTEEMKNEALEEVVQFSSEVELEQNLDAYSCSGVMDEKVEVACEMDTHARYEHVEGLAGSHALDVDNGSVEAHKNTCRQKNLPEKDETLNSSDSKTAESCLIEHGNVPTGDPTNEPMAVMHSGAELSNDQITGVEAVGLHADHAQESSLEPVLFNDLVDPHQAATEESKLSVKDEAFLSLDNHEDTAVESQDNSEGAPSKDKELDSHDSCPVESSEVHEGTSKESDAKESDTSNSHLVDDPTIQAEAENIPVANGTMFHCPIDDVRTEIEIGTISLTFSSRDVNPAHAPPKDVPGCAGSNGISSCNLEGDIHTHDSVNKASQVSTPKYLKAKSQVQNLSTAHKNDDHVSESEVMNESVIEDDVNIQSGVIQNARIDGEEKPCEDLEGIDAVHMNESSASTLEGSDVQNVLNDVGRRPFYYMIKLPRYFELEDQIATAELQVAEKTKSRDAIQAEKQVIKAKCREYGDSMRAARAACGDARGLLMAKRREMDSVNLVIERIKIASQVEDIDGRIRNMEHRMQHETLPLKEEKQFIREIKQLKQDRENLACKMGNQAEVQQAVDQKDEAEKRLKLLKKEAEMLRENITKTEDAAKDAKDKYEEKHKKLKELEAQYEVANTIRQEAFAHLQSLKKRSNEKRKCFSKYKGDSETAKALALKRDIMGLHHHCVNQVERVMELWNNDNEFREDYVRCNLRSTVWRLGTLDGRSLGPNEEPPLVSNVTRTVAKDSILSSNHASEGEKPVAPVDKELNNDKSMVKVGDKNNNMTKPKNPAKPAPLENGLTAAPSGDKIEEAREEEHRRTQEEEQVAKKEEELRKQEELARLKEQRKMEEKAKAQEAIERKKRNAERAQARAVLKAQKEAEEKEKKREKRARKNEQRKGETEVTNAVNEGDCAPDPKDLTQSKDSEAREKPSVVAKRPQKSQPFTKQTKSKSIPPPLRNRGKKKIQTWLWVLLAILVVFALFLLGNSSFSLKSWKKGFGF